MVDIFCSLTICNAITVCRLQYVRRKQLGWINLKFLEKSGSEMY